ncbi:hypothetical protein [uncultured Tessaracoccus sp.]|uniref:hypothetical protein n=1 Tax=uncultured Tessaracoccus sp. TaxID=905023 RepID=UPI002634CCCE|nr:hypothetical protein [uncultured Tessaracoccus sp.]
MNRTVILTADEALVLLDWLSRHDEPGALPADDVEQRVLWNLAASLEYVVVEAFDPDYATLLAAARNRLIAD